MIKYIYAPWENKYRISFSQCLIKYCMYFPWENKFHIFRINLWREQGVLFSLLVPLYLFVHFPSSNIVLIFPGKINIMFYLLTTSSNMVYILPGNIKPIFATLICTVSRGCYSIIGTPSFIWSLPIINYSIYFPLENKWHILFPHYFIKYGIYFPWENKCHISSIQLCREQRVLFLLVVPPYLFAHYPSSNMVFIFQGKKMPYFIRSLPPWILYLLSWENKFHIFSISLCYE